MWSLECLKFPLGFGICVCVGVRLLEVFTFKWEVGGEELRPCFLYFSLINNFEQLLGVRFLW